MIFNFPFFNFFFEKKSALPDNQVGFAVFRLQAENVGNTGAGIKTEANVVLQWKGPSCNALAKNKSNGALQTALSKLVTSKESFSNKIESKQFFLFFFKCRPQTRDLLKFSERRTLLLTTSSTDGVQVLDLRSLMTRGNAVFVFMQNKLVALKFVQVFLYFFFLFDHPNLQMCI